MKQNIFDKYSNVLKAKINPEKFFFSPYKKNCIILYNGEEIYNSVWFYDFSVLYFNNEKLDEITSLDSLIYCWYEQDSISWSDSSRYCSISIAVKNKKINISLEAKLIVDTQNQKYAVIPLAGSRNYKVDFLDDNKIIISTKLFDNNNEYIEILRKDAELKIFKWLPISDTAKINILFYQGYFGNIMSGYKQKNIFINNNKVMPVWPYK